MEKFVHFDLTKSWAEEQGFEESQSEKIAAASWAIDQKWWTKPWTHFAVCGAYIFAYFFLLIALTFNSLRFLGYAIHAFQDAISHGWIMPWNHNRKHSEIDRWERASADKKKAIEEKTKRFLEIFKRPRRFVGR